MAIIQNLESFVQPFPAGLDTITELCLSQNENGRQLQFKILGITIPSGSVATISGTKPDGVVYSKTGTISGSDTVIVDEDTQMTAVSGTWDAKIHIVNSGDTIASARVRFIIDSDPVEPGSVPSSSQLDGIIAECQAYVDEVHSSAYGSPLVAATVAGMTDQTKVYVYTGSEDGYTAGNWYYWNGSAWTSGGVYNSIALQTDKTLTLEDWAADSKAVGDLKANRSGIEDSLTSGTSKQLLSESYTENSLPYLYRQSHSGIGDREMDEIVGGSVGWNQIINVISNGGTGNGVTFTKNADGSWTPSGTPTNDNAFYNLDVVSGRNYLRENHVYFLPKGTSDSRSIGVGLAADSMISSYLDPHDELLKITAAQANASLSWVRLQVSNLHNTELSGNIKIWPQLYDITQMLGSTIADYIYSLETSTAGTGVAKLKEWGFFGKDYYPYNAGSLESVKTSGKVTVGKNLLDMVATDFRDTTSGGLSRLLLPDKTSFIMKGTASTGRVWGNPGGTGTMVLKAGTYTLSQTGDCNGLAIELDGTTIYDSGTFTLTKDAVVTDIGIYINSGTTYDTIIHPMLRRSGASATFEPYQKNTYPLDSTLTLRGIPKKDANNNLYYDGDVYRNDGTVTRRFGIYTFTGSETWSAWGNAYYTTCLPVNGNTDNTKTANIFNAIGLPPVLHTDLYSGGGTSGMGQFNKNIYIPATDYQATISKLAGTSVVYELATPTTETADPYTPVMLCDPDGTEEYIDTRDVPIPVGHNTKYPANLRKRLDTIPDLPTSAGSYRLKVTVTGGVPSYEWTTS